MTEPATRFEDPVPERIRAELDERLVRNRRLGANMLVLCDDAAACAAEAARLTSGPLAGQVLCLDATGLGVQALFKAMYACLAEHYRWPEFADAGEEDAPYADT